MIKHVSTCFLEGVVEIPSSKSDGQRAILCSGLCSGKSTIENLGDSDDEFAMLDNIQRMGASVKSIKKKKFEIEGIIDLTEDLELNCGESGLGLRLTTCVLAAFDGRKQITGHGSILKRKHSFFDQFFAKNELRFSSNNGKLPFEIEGKLNGGVYSVDGSQSSQFISGLLIALPLLEEDSILKVHRLKSKPYVQMTLDTIRKFGIEIECENYEHFVIKGRQEYLGTNYSVENDWSSASYWLAASAIGHQVRLKGLNLRSSQADKWMLEALKNAGCCIVEEDGLVQFKEVDLKHFEFDATDCPDLFPALVSVAAFCDGKSIIHGVNRLQNKESNRALVLKNEFAKLGLRIELVGDEMHVNGGGELHGGIVDSNNDHRIAMSLAIVGTRVDQGVEILDAQSVTKSYPSFWEDLTQLMIVDH